MKRFWRCPTCWSRWRVIVTVPHAHRDGYRPEDISVDESQWHGTPFARGPDHEITHRCPPAGSGVMPCCGRTPFEVPRYHRVTLDDALVTCARVSRIDGHD